MDKSRIEKLLLDNYGIAAVEIEEGPRQFVAETFICFVNGIGKYFIKIIPQTDLSQKIIKSLPVLRALNQAGLQNIPQIIHTKKNELYIENSEFIFVVFSFIEGEQTFEYDNGLLGKSLASLHTLTKKVNVPVEKEAFSSYVDELFPKNFTQALKASNDPIKEELRKILLSHKAEIRNDWDNFQEIIQNCKKIPTSNLVLTHGDGLGNVIVNKSGELFVVDWDDIMLAPAERDLWFLRDNFEFMQVYRETYPEYQINPTFYKYYLLWRMFDDLLGWTGEILSDESETRRRKNLEDLKKDYLGWLLPLVRGMK